jgi:hypothetical protein
MRPEKHPRPSGVKCELDKEQRDGGCMQARPSRTKNAPQCKSHQNVECSPDWCEDPARWVERWFSKTSKPRRKIWIRCDLTKNRGRRNRAHSYQSGYHVPRSFGQVSIIRPIRYALPWRAADDMHLPVWFASFRRLLPPAPPARALDCQKQKTRAAF